MHWHLVALSACCFAVLLPHAWPSPGGECVAVSRQLWSLGRSVCRVTRATQRPRWSGGASRRNSERSMTVLPHEYVAQDTAASATEVPTPVACMAVLGCALLVQQLKCRASARVPKSSREQGLGRDALLPRVKAA